MSAEDYVRTYLQLWCWVNDTFTVVRVRNYLQSGLGTQASRAATAYSQLLSALPKVAGVPRVNNKIKGDNKACPELAEGSVRPALCVTHCSSRIILQINSDDLQTLSIAPETDLGQYGMRWEHAAVKLSELQHDSTKS
jgi:hypothetical protein